MKSVGVILKTGSAVVRCTKVEGIHRLGASFPVSATRSLKIAIRSMSTGVAVEDKITSILNHEFEPTFVDVKDVSGGCGAMFNITVESHKFKGISLVNQHKMVTKALSNEIKDMHGLTVKTSIPK